MTTAKDLGRLFKDAREQKKLDVSEAGRRTRIHPNVIADIENGSIDRLSPVYMRSFIKKYASFLEMDAEKTLDKYSAFFDKFQKKRHDTGACDEARLETAFMDDFFKKEAEEREAASSSVSGSRRGFFLKILFIAAAVVLVVMIGRRACIRREAAPAVRQSVPSPATKAAEKEAAPFNLTLKARGSVWIQILSKGKTVFAGVLGKNEMKTITSREPITVWTGKGEYLDFTVNGAKIGKVADGVVKNIEVSAESIKVGGKLVKQLK